MTSNFKIDREKRKNIFEFGFFCANMPHDLEISETILSPTTNNYQRLPEIEKDFCG